MKYFSALATATAFILVSTIRKSAAADVAEFPQGGTYQEQSDWVHDLPGACLPERAEVTRKILNADDPFQAAKEYATGHEFTVNHHTYDATYGVVVQRKITDQVDTETVLIGGEAGDGKALTFEFTRDQSGLLKPIGKKRVPVTDYAAGIEESKAGLVVGANSCWAAKPLNKPSP